MLFALTVFGQDKKVAVVTFGVNRYVGTRDLANGASIAAGIASLAKNPNFKLEGVLDNFYSVFFNEYAQSFPFKLLPETQVLENEQYKNYKTVDTTSYSYKFQLLKKGYNNLAVSILYKKDINKMIEIFGNESDGYMFVNLEFEFAPKVAFGGMGTAGISAYANISIWNKEGKKVVSIYEFATSKGTVPLIAGVPAIKLEQILPLCQDASDRLLSDLKGKLPKIIKKANEKL
jgi:hypothetical protein